MTRFPLRPQRGFALLLTLTLLSFVVLLLVGLATYTRVETAVAGNTQRQAQARENALLGLNVALDQLQRHAGPDTRVTATAAALTGVNAQKRYYTGVWDSTPSDSGPRAWLASGAETAAGIDVTAAIPAARQVPLVSTQTDTSTTTNFPTPIPTEAALQDITAPGLPGQVGAARATIGRYAWWVGDQGVKAPIAVPDTVNDIDYAPFADGGATDLRTRIRQQISLGPDAIVASGSSAFDARDANNRGLVPKIAAMNQVAFLRSPANAALGIGVVRANFQAWSPGNFAVLANSKSGGLRQDLSLRPGLLGNAFAAWADYAAYMESLVPAVAAGEVTGAATSSSSAPSILPAYGTDPVRRRYVMTPHQRDVDVGGSHQVGPVLSEFGLTFNVRTLPSASGNSVVSIQPLETRAAWMISLWNPYTSALVPENLRIEISGLPRVSVVKESDGATVSSFSIAELYGDDADAPLRVSLPWDAENVPSTAPAEDRRSWLPGRVYTWRSIEDTTKGAIPAGGYPSRFYTRDFTATGETNGGVQRSAPGTVRGDEVCHLLVEGSDTPTSNLIVAVYAVRDGGDVLLGRFESPAFMSSFETTARMINASTYQFAYVFRLKESIDTIAEPSSWLTTPTIDFRRTRVPGEAFVLENGDNPAVYENGLTSGFMTAKPDRLLFRAGDAYSYNEDVPLFELPRAPLLSLGALQHFRIVNSRPFMIGNPWGSAATLNSIPLGELFDRFFFSGLAPGVTPGTTASGELIMPNPLLKSFRKADGARPTINDVRATSAVVASEDPDVPSVTGDAMSSRFFLQGAVFNANSTQRQAWIGVLRGIRFTAPLAFTYLDALSASGTADDTALASVQSNDAQFFRFSQSAQETYKAEAGSAESGEFSTPSVANTHLFRKGMRTLTADQVRDLAEKIVELIAIKHNASAPEGGPFRSLDEFLAPSTLFAGADAAGNALAPRSLLEAAIEAAQLNREEALGLVSTSAEFSSQWLTQADIMTALAPILFVRSDTFLIRTYGEAVNPATGAVEGRAWGEATVQRVPEYFEPAANEPYALPDSLSDLNQRYGRRFKVVSFRWLTRSDI